MMEYRIKEVVYNDGKKAYIPQQESAHNCELTSLEDKDYAFGVMSKDWVSFKSGSGEVVQFDTMKKCIKWLNERIEKEIKTVNYYYEDGKSWKRD